MSEAESPQRVPGAVTFDHIIELTSPATPHFALQIRNRIARLIEPLSPQDPVRRFGEQEIRRLRQLAAAGEQERGRAGVEPLPRLVSVAADPIED